MTITVEVPNKDSLYLLKAMESIGLIHLQAPASQDAESSAVNPAPSTEQDEKPWHWLRGCCKGIPGASVDDFLARCREDKEHELAIEKRQEEERERARRNCGYLRPC